MKIITYAIFFLITVCSIAACKKTFNISIRAVDLNGLNGGTENAYAGIDFAIVQSRPGWKTDKFERVYEGIFNKKGHASFDLKMQKNWSYILTMNEPESICYSEAFGIRLDNENSNVVTFNYAKCGNFKFILNNENCTSSDDQVTYERSWIGTNERTGFYTYYGCEFFEGNFFELPAGSYNYSWTVTKNNISTSFSEDFTVTAGENTTFAINY